MFIYRYKCPAKVNLSLAIIGKDERTGFHLLDTVIGKIDLYDEIELSLSGGDGIRTRFEWIDTERDETLDEQANTVSRAYELLNLEVGNTLPGMDVRVCKGIPTCSGLGGAASDAAGFLRLIRHIAVTTAEFSSSLKERISEIDLKRLGKIGFQVGADVPAFLHDGTVRVRGLGEAVEKIELQGLDQFKVLIAVPRTRLSTKEMYSRVRLAERRNHTVDFLCKWFAEGPYAGFSVAKNDFQPIACEQSPEIRAVIDTLRSAGFPLVTLPGTGSAVVALYEKAFTIREVALPENVTAFHCQIHP